MHGCIRECMYVCVCTCMYGCRRACTYTPMHTCIHVYTHTYIHIRTYIHAYIHVYTQFGGLSIHTYILAYTHTPIHPYIHVYTLAHMYVCVCTCMYVCRRGCTHAWTDPQIYNFMKKSVFFGHKNMPPEMRGVGKYSGKTYKTYMHTYIHTYSGKSKRANLSDLVRTKTYIPRNHCLVI